MEATNPGIMLKFSIAEDANILDLINPDVAKKMGYIMGLTHEESHKLMKGWDLSGVDAIKYPTEKNPAGVNYGVINSIEGVE